MEPCSLSTLLIIFAIIVIATGRLMFIPSSQVLGQSRATCRSSGRGVTPQAAALASKAPFTHSPGHLFLTDVPNSALAAF
jgi:hypothetical protein